MQIGDLILQPLITAIINTQGPVLELGCGDFSTPILHALCAPTQRYLLSADTDQKWIQNFIDLENSWHQFMYIPAFRKRGS